MKTSAATLLAAALATGCSAAQSNDSRQPETTVQAYGLSISVPAGWEARVYRLSPQYAITLEAASVGLPPRGQLMTGDRLRTGDAYIRIDDIGPPLVYEVRLSISVDPEDIGGPYEGGFPAGGFAAVIDDRDLMIRVRFGSQPDEREIDAVQRVLASFSATPLP